MPTRRPVTALGMLGKNWWRFCLLLTIALVATFVWAFRQRSSALDALHLVVGSKCRMLIVQAFAMACFTSAVAGLTTLLFGTITWAEFEELRSCCARGSLELLLTLAMFRTTLSLSFTIMIGALVLAKILHWMLQTRVKSVVNGLYRPEILIGIYLQLVLVMMLLILADCIALRWIATNYGLAWPPSAEGLLFGFEWSVLAVGLFSQSAKLLLATATKHCCSIHRGLALLLVDLVGGLLQSALYAVLLALVWTINAPPAYLVGQFFDKAEETYRRVCGLRRYQRLAADGLRGIPDCSTNMLAGLRDEVCIICREQLLNGTTPKLLRCGHVIHKECLLAWMQQQQVCPTCREPVLVNEKRD